MTKPKNDLTYEQVAEWLSYDPEIGEITWIKGPLRGRKAGTVNHGYLQIKLFQRGYRGHRLAWLLHTGSWPEDEIDHIDRDPMNNKISNLRVACRTLNNRNKPAVGATYHKQRQKWVAQIKIGGGAKKHLGVFDTQEEASQAYFAAKEHYHPQIRVVEGGDDAA